MFERDEKLVSVGTFDSPHLAEIAKLRLESEGIPVVIPGRAPSPFAGGHAAPWGGLQLKVRESDEARAAQILREAATAESAADLCHRCPRCGSDKVRLARPSLLRALIGLVTPWSSAGEADRGSGSCAPHDQMSYRCRACGHVWGNAGQEEAG